MTQANERPMTARQSRVLAVAAEMFADRGYDTVTMRQIGERLGVTARALYRHFPDKGSMLDAATEAFLADVDRLLENLPTDEDRHDWVAQYVSLLRRDPNVTRLIAAEVAWPRHGSIGQRARDHDAKVSLILAPTGETQADRGAEALGLLWWPIACRRELRSEDAQQTARRALAAGAALP